MSGTIKHSSKSNEHYSPEPILFAARELFNSEIDLDPASSKEVNERTVKAKQFYTIDDDGLSKEWKAKNIFLNCPGGVINRQSSMAIWFDKMVGEYRDKRFEEGLFLGFNLEILRSSQHERYKAWIAEFPICYFRSRIAFLDKDFKPQMQPAHPNLIAYFPKDNASIERFASIFSKFGKIQIPR